MGSWLDGFMVEAAPETIVAEEHFVHPLNPPPAGDIPSDLGVRFPPLAGARGWSPNIIFRFQLQVSNFGLSGALSWLDGFMGTWLDGFMVG